MIQTECGIFSIISKKYNTSNEVLYNLKKLQHRGRESFGISWFYDKIVNNKKYIGIIEDKYINENLLDNSNNTIYSKNWIGHVRYSTSGSLQKLHFTQPIVSYKYNFSLAHNGNIPFSIWSKINKKFNYTISNDDVTDTYILYGFIEYMLNKNNDMLEIIKYIIQNIEGVYCLLISTHNSTYICRDRFGVRPICYCYDSNNIYVASESCALDNKLKHNDVEPGEIIHIDNESLEISNIYKYNDVNYKFCIFEFIYFMKDESMINTLYVKTFKEYIGKILAEQYLKTINNNSNDYIVCGIPNSGLIYGTSFAKYTNFKYEQFLQRKNNYNLRTFILKTNKQRLDACKQKYEISIDIKNKKIILIDDSIVRGNTLKYLITLIKSYNPKEIHFVVACPPIKYTCSYGVDFADIEDLIANKMSVDEMIKFYNLDSLLYLDIEQIKNINLSTNNFCNACFSGNYLF